MTKWCYDKKAEYEEEKTKRKNLECEYHRRLGHKDGIVSELRGQIEKEAAAAEERRKRACQHYDPENGKGKSKDKGDRDDNKGKGKGKGKGDGEVKGKGKA
eukprot:2768632-Heterocapsa_arctica.AAC.1